MLDAKLVGQTREPALNLPKDRLVHMLYQMRLIRAFEEAAHGLYAAGKVHGTMHLYAGEEAVAVGAIAALRPDDALSSTHRGHGHAIARGLDVAAMMAELLGKETGVCRGRGGSMHMADLDLGILGANGIVAGGIPLAVGAGLSLKMQGTDRVVLCFFGDGAANTGNFHESLNLAAIWKLPVIFLCENNQYAMSMPSQRAVAAPDIAARATAYGIPGERVDGMDALAVYQVVSRAVARARRGDGPTLLEAITYRYFGHSKSDRQVYRAREEIQEWKGRDPIDRLQAWLIEQGLLTPTEAQAIERQAEETIQGAIAFAEASPDPAIEDLLDGVTAEEAPAGTPTDTVTPTWARVTFGSRAILAPAPGERVITYAEALREALHQALEADPNVFLIGEDIGVYGGAFGVTQGLIEQFGPERVRDTPISENTIVGAALGASLTGMRPVAEIQFMDFVALAMEQVALQGAKIRYMFGGRARVPVVLRLPGGSGTGAAAQHSGSVESWFVNVPGLKVIAPATAYDAKGLLLAAIADDNPVIFVEHKLLYRTRGAVPEEPYVLPIGAADVKRLGHNVSIVAASIMAPRALEAAGRLAQDGIEAEVIDLRTLKPYDAQTIIASVKKTGRLLVVHEAPLIGGYGGEIAAMVAQSEAFAYLEAPIVRLGGAEVPIPYNPHLERAAVPQTEDIFDAARRLVRLEI